LKNIFCNINTQYFNIFHGPSFFFENRNSMLAHYDAVFKGWLHFIGLLFMIFVRLNTHQAARRPDG
ncbi:hypothetical protein, partial [Coxiella burnetii]|uniref:hypothetical protein n=1 Tax=Coxiella burnetii TaxID=777 RepID=UPI003FA582F7